MFADSIQMVSGRVRCTAGDSADGRREVHLERPHTAAGAGDGVRERARHHCSRLRSGENVHLLRLQLHGVYWTLVLYSYSGRYLLVQRCTWWSHWQLSLTLRVWRLRAGSVRSSTRRSCGSRSA